MTALLTLMGNQLYPISSYPPADSTSVLMVEDAQLCQQFRFHRQKLGFVLSAMREHATALRHAGYRVDYYPLAANANFGQQVEATANERQAEKLLGFQPASRGQAATLGQAFENTRLPVTWLDDPMFLRQVTGSGGVTQLLGKGSPRMVNFYKRQRLHHQILLDGNKPRGGKWSLDADNRKSLPAKQVVPDLPEPQHSQTTLQTLEEVDGRFPSHAGCAQDLWLPTTRQGALDWLATFLQQRFTGFGTYEDAISSRSPTLFHSQLSAFLNVGLITPQEVLDTAVAAMVELDVPLNDAEGFVRQLIGWREFVRLVYLQHGKDMRRTNYWNATRRMAPSWSTASTGILPLDDALKVTQRYAWNHHIDRLMVIANLHNLCEIHPDESYRFFMENYVDAYDWVMVPNVFGMGLMSDGGTFATKPYICGSNYLLKMADYGKAGKGEWCEVVDGLYWRFIDKHRKFFSANARLKMMLGTLDRMAGELRQRIFSKAEGFLDKHTVAGAN